MMKRIARWWRSLPTHGRYDAEIVLIAFAILVFIIVVRLVAARS